MPVWLVPIFSFFGKRALHFIVYALIAGACWGVYHKIFIAPTSKTSTSIGRIDRQVNVYSTNADANLPLFGCSAYRLSGRVYWENKNKSLSK